MSTPSFMSRVLGCLLGGAVGDALGAPVEFMTLDEILDSFGPEGITGYMEAYGRFGAITDDTQMSLFTAEGLIRAQARFWGKGIAHVPSVVHHAYLRWLATQEMPASASKSGPSTDGWLITNEFLHNRRAPGNTCMSALQTGHQGTVYQPLNQSKGCGGVMRIAPVGLIARDPFRLGIDIAALTHGHPSGYLAAGALALMLSTIVGGGTLTEAVMAAVTETRAHPGHEETVEALERAVAMAAEGDGGGGRVEVLGEGWVAEEALAMSVFCALVSDGFLPGVLLAVNHGGDSDSTGAITRNLLGTLLGIEAIPQHLLTEVEGHDVIEQVAKDLAEVFGDRQEPDTDRYPPWWAPSHGAAHRGERWGGDQVPALRLGEPPRGVGAR